jgi:hypothetical protein
MLCGTEPWCAEHGKAEEVEARYEFSHTLHNLDLRADFRLRLPMSNRYQRYLINTIRNKIREKSFPHSKVQFSEELTFK